MLTFWRRSILARAAIQVVGIGLIVGLAFVFLTAYLTSVTASKAFLSASGS